MRSRISRFCASFTIFLLTIVIAASTNAQQNQEAMLVRPIEGLRMIVGNGDVPDYIQDCFVYLCRKHAPHVVVFNLDGKARVSENQLKKSGAGSVHMVDSIPKDLEGLTHQLLDADGVWIEGNPNAIAEHSLILALMKNVTRRNGVVAFGSSAEALIGQVDENAVENRVESPFAKSEFHFETDRTSDANKQANSAAKIHWMIPDSTAMVVHQGRWVTGYGGNDIQLSVPAANGWPMRQASIECIDVFESSDSLGYSLDLLSWVRSAAERGRPIFPPTIARTPAVEKGTLFLHGGSRLHQEVMKEFIKIAGGENASFVCIPSAQRFDSFEEPDSYSAGMLNELGCRNVNVIHTDDPLVADQSETFAKLLKNAKGVWIDGGRTFRFMDSYENTRVESLIRQVLQRGGVVGGSSAGCQVPSDFLVRGNPGSNQDISFEGYTRGMGLIKGVIIDAHFLQRGRHEPFMGLMKQHPQMLGIGIDESTALVVKGKRATVLGENSVSFYNLSTKADGDFSPAILNAGQTYDLKLRKVSSQTNH